MERRFAGCGKGGAVFGLNPVDERMTMHRAAYGCRLYWCDCLPAFRVGSEVHYPRDTRHKRWKLLRGAKPRPYWHRNRTAAAMADTTAEKG